MTHRSSAATVALAGLVALAIVVPASETGAHGGRVQLAKVPAGPYLVSVWTLPDPPRAGSLDVSLAVMEPRTEQSWRLQHLANAYPQVVSLPVMERTGRPDPLRAAEPVRRGLRLAPCLTSRLEAYVRRQRPVCARSADNP